MNEAGFIRTSYVELTLIPGPATIFVTEAFALIYAVDPDHEI
jgi:hypothetical protein